MSPGAIFTSVFTIRIGRQLIQFSPQMRDYPISAKRMILIVDILHDLPILDRIISRLNMLLVPLIKAVTLQRHHCPLQRFLILCVLFQPFHLCSVPPCQYAHRKYTYLLNPVFLHCFSDHFPVQMYPFFPVLYPDPAASAVVIRNALDPCSTAAVPYRALLPGTVIAVPDRRIHVRHRHGDACHAGVVAGIAAGRRSLSIINDQRRIAFRQVRLLSVEECRIAAFAQRMRGRIAVKLTRQRA